MWLVASSMVGELAAVRDGNPALWRDVRRFNAPVQLAVAAAHEVLGHAAAPAELAIVALAPCQAGSPELHRWVREIEGGGAVKMNPTHTLHAVDNLALSVLSIALGNHAWAMSLGGAAGMAWAALELVLERDEREILVVGGDQLSGVAASPALGCALLFARERTPYGATGRATRLAGIERRRTDPETGRVPDNAERGSEERPRSADVVAHATAGVVPMLAALREAASGRFAYRVPPADGDGLDEIVAHWEVG